MKAQRHGLVHDAAVAYLSDVSGPVEKDLPGYKHAERYLDTAIADALDLEAGKDEKERLECADGPVNEYEFPDASHMEPDLQYDPDAVDTGADDKALFRGRANSIS